MGSVGWEQAVRQKQIATAASAIPRVKKTPVWTRKAKVCEARSMSPGLQGACQSFRQLLTHGTQRVMEIHFLRNLGIALKTKLRRPDSGKESCLQGPFPGSI